MKKWIALLALFALTLTAQAQNSLIQGEVVYTGIRAVNVENSNNSFAEVLTQQGGKSVTFSIDFSKTTYDSIRVTARFTTNTAGTHTIKFENSGATVAPTITSTGVVDTQLTSAWVYVGDQSTAQTFKLYAKASSSTGDIQIYYAAYDLMANEGVGTGGTATIKEGGSSVGDGEDHALDFGAGFDITESPADEFNIVLDYTEDPVNIGGSEITGTLLAASGGTGLSSYAIGDMLYITSITPATFARLAGVATGNVLLSGGVGAAPAWGKVTLGTHTTGTLTEAQGGTGDTDLDDVLGTASEIEVTDGANSVIAGNVTVGLADEPIIPGDYFTWPISTAANDPVTPVAGMGKYQPGDSSFHGYYGAGLTKDRFALVDRDGITVTAVDTAVVYFDGLDAVNGSADVLYSPTLRSLIISRGTTSGGGIYLKEDGDNGDQSVNIKAPASITSSYDFIFPTSMGTSGQFLKTTGSAGTWDNINSADIDLTDNYTWTGNHDFGGGTAVEVPNAAGGTTVNATGEVTVDATSGTFNYYDGTAERVLSPVQSKSFTIVVATTSSDYHLWRVPSAYANGITIISISVLNEGAGDVVGCLDEMDSDGNNAVAIDSDMTAVAGTNNTNTTLDNPTVDAGDYIDWHTTSVAAANVQLTVTWEFRINP